MSMSNQSLLPIQCSICGFVRRMFDNFDLDISTGEEIVLCAWALLTAAIRKLLSYFLDFTFCL
jgi:hypothetical protein